MIARWILLALLPVVACISLIQSRRLSAIIGMGLFSFILAAVYLLMQAPDVAITEATIGAALVTAIYVLAIRRTGRLTVVADEVPGLIAREGGQLAGLEYEILEGFAREQGLDLAIQFVPLRRVQWLVAHREADIGAGGLIPLQNLPSSLAVTPNHLDTGIYAFESQTIPSSLTFAPDYDGYFSELIPLARGGSLSSAVVTLDLARVLALSRHGVSLNGLARLEGDHHGYAFVMAGERPELQRKLASYLEELRSSGRLESAIRRYIQ